MARSGDIIETQCNRRGGSVVSPVVDQDGIGRWGDIVKGDRVCQVTRNIICRILEPEIDLFSP